MTITLSSTYLERDALRSPHFFNGRLLSAEDMVAEHGALRTLLEQLGRATGSGIVEGLQVAGAIGGSTVTTPTVTVSPGFGLTPAGRGLELSQPVEVSLLEPPKPPTSTVAASANAFRTCNDGAPPTTSYAVGKGIYVLLIGSARGREGRAPVSGLGALNVCCGDKSVVEGIMFRLVRLDELSGLFADANHLRNAVAHQCLGAPDPLVSANPFGTSLGAYGVVDALRPSRMGEDEIPLAVVHWTDTGGIRFVDNWAVRRRLVRPEFAPSRFATGLSDRRIAEGEARFLQFQEHLGALEPPGASSFLQANSAFRFLPAVGLLPVGGIDGAVGFDHPTFFAGLTMRMGLTLEGARLASLLRASLAYPPIDLSSKELIWVYRVRENIKFGASSPGRPYLVFANGHMPYAGESRYDASYWNGANFEI